MDLNDLEFSDIILSASPGPWFLKGTPDLGHGLIPVSAELREHLRTLLPKLTALYEASNPTRSFRLTQDGIAFRTAMYDDIHQGQTFFLRRLPATTPEFDKLGLPPQIMEWLLRTENAKGLVLFCGAQASGKTTSASAFIAARLKRHGGHAITYEHPVEMPIAGQHGAHGFCYQTDIASEEELPAHIESAHRYSAPDIVFIGEIRTKHAASEALRVALGSNQQLVVGTIHGLDIKSGLDRLLTWAKEMDGAIALQNLAQTLLCVIHQGIKYQAGSTPQLHIPEFLFLPDGSADHIRAKIREGNLFLSDEIREQKNRLLHEGKI